MLACFGLPQAAPEDSPSPLTRAHRRRRGRLGSNVGSERSASLSRPSLDRRSSSASASGGTIRLRRSKQGVLRLVLLAIAGLTSNRPAHLRRQCKAQQQQQSAPPAPCDDSPAESPSAQQLDPATVSSRADDLAATQTLSFLDSEASSSVPASEFVFSVLPAKSANGPAKSSSGRSRSREDAGRRDADPPAEAAPVAGGRQPAANTILKPMASAPPPPRSLSGRLPSLRRPLASSKSLPSPAQLAHSCMQPEQLGRQQLSTVAPPPPLPPPPPSLANSRRPLKHLPSLTPSDRSYGSSLLSAAFDRHDTKTSTHVDSSSRSDAASPRTASGASSSTSSSSSSSATAPSSVPSSCAATSPRTSPFSVHRKGAREAAKDRGSAADKQSTGRASQQEQQQEQQQQGQQRQQVDEEVPLAPHEVAALRAARAFSDAFLKALSEGDTKWGSNPQLSGLFAESARMLTHDGQLFNGRTAIIRRLNAGMEQLHKLVGSVAGDAGGGEAQAQPAAESAGNAMEGGAAAPQTLASMASKVQHSMDVQLLPPAAHAANGAAKGRGSSGLRALLSRVFSRKAASSDKASAVRRRPTPHSSAASSTSASGTVRVVVVHSFRFGLRRFRLQDHFAVRGGSIIRLKRTRG